MKNFFGSLLIFLLAGISIAAQTGAPEQRIKDYFKAFNSDDEKTMRDFLRENVAPESFKQHPLDDQIEFYRRLRGEMQSVELKRITSSIPSEFVAEVQTKQGEQVNFSFGFQPNEPRKISRMRIEHYGNPDGAPNDQPRPNESKLPSEVRSYLNKAAASDEFSGAVLIAKNNTPVYEEAFGLADKDKKFPNRVDTKFNLGSINKLLTQAAVEQLVEQGELSLNDKLEKFLPDYPNRVAAAKITVRHLLTMTSGIGDIFGEKFNRTPKANLRNIADFIPLFSGEPLAFEPGTNNQYSNGGYVLLGAIIEKVSGKSYYDYMRENIFGPLGMTDTDFYEADKSVPNMAEGYTKIAPNQVDKTRWQNNLDTRSVRGTSAGGGYSTLEDLLKFSLALQNGKIHLPEQKEFRGVGVIGGAPGINATFEVMPQTGYTIVVMSNYDPPAAMNVSRELRNLFARAKA